MTHLNRIAVLFSLATVICTDLGGAVELDFHGRLG